jgi:hypothetical protein
VNQRYCPDCDKWYPATPEYFYVAQMHKDKDKPILRRLCKRHYNLDCASARNPDRQQESMDRRARRQRTPTRPNKHRRAAFRRLLGGQ